MNILEFAINFENEAEKYYLDQAQINKDNSLHTVCLMLAEDEKKHALILNSKLHKTPYILKDDKTLIKAKKIFMNVGNIKSEIRKIPNQLEFYRVASEKEKKSVDFYTGLLSKAADDDETALYKFLIRQEEQHMEVLGGISLLLSHTEEWVESAEFGKYKSRGEY